MEIHSVFVERNVDIHTYIFDQKQKFLFFSILKVELNVNKRILMGKFKSFIFPIMELKLNKIIKKNLFLIILFVSCNIVLRE